MSFRTITPSRDELYQKVWERPIAMVAKEYGTTAAGLRRLCRRLGVPTPGKGYWVKKKHGMPVRRSALPPPPADMKPDVTIPTLERVPPDPEQLDRANEIIDAERLEANRVRVPEVLSKPHPAVAHTLKVMRKAKPGKDGRIEVADPKCLPVAVSPSQMDRALRIMDALLKAFAAREYAVTIGGDDGRQELSVVVLGEPVAFSLHEKLDRVLAPTSPRQQEDGREREEYHHVPSGTLALELDPNLRYNSRRRWADNKKGSIEASLNSFLIGLVKIAVAVRAERLDREREDREQRRGDLLAAPEAESPQLSQLDREVALWHKAKQIRAYVEAIRVKTLAEHGRIDPGSEVDEWITWALAQADRYDPLVASSTSAPSPFGK